MKYIALTASAAAALLAAGAANAGGVPVLRGAVPALDSSPLAEVAPTEDVVVVVGEIGAAVEVREDEGEGKEDTEEEVEEIEPVEAVLWPFFVQALGIVVFIISTRHYVVLPYTAILFLLGLFMGLGQARLNNSNGLMNSINQWHDIDSEVLFNVFLPGLIFSDSYALDTHLFQVSFWQCIILAFPMVLGGTCLTALVARYVLPYGWSWNLSMTIGSILSATDPVAVAALLSTVGAPPRLNALISGESLLNDGSAIVFFTIFNDLFLHEESIGGRSYTWTQGIGKFCQMSLGAAAIGVAFGTALIGLLYLLKRRLNEEENVLQVAATFTVAYLTYYTADVICHTSGVIATLTCGVMCKALGSSMINSQEIMANFWSLVEHFLNTMLFGLGGLVWGGIIANGATRVDFDGADWGYLFLFFVLLVVIRFVLLAMVYPVIKRIGLGANIPETIFLGYGGLRGAVGITLALALDKELRKSNDQNLEDVGTKLFGMIGGIAFLTLVINGSTAGALLNWLGLTKSTVVREKVTAIYKGRFREQVLDDFVRLLSLGDGHIQNGMDWAIVREHVPPIRDMTLEDLRRAAIRAKENAPSRKYNAPRLENVLPYFVEAGSGVPDLSWARDLGEPVAAKPSSTIPPPSDASSDLEVLTGKTGTSEEAKELRLIFLELLRFGYDQLFAEGLLDPREGGPGFVAYVLRKGLDFASDGVKNGNEPLNDYDCSHVVERPWELHRARLAGQVSNLFARCLRKKVAAAPTKEQQRVNLAVDLSVAFIHAHRAAQECMENQFGNLREEDPTLRSSFESSAASKATFAEVYRLVVLESEAEIRKAEAALADIDAGELRIAKDRLFCRVMLGNAVRDLARSRDVGLLSPIEAERALEEVGAAYASLSRSGSEYPGEMSEEEKRAALERARVVV